MHKYRNTFTKVCIFLETFEQIKFNKNSKSELYILVKLLNKSPTCANLR